MLYESESKCTSALESKRANEFGTLKEASRSCRKITVISERCASVEMRARDAQEIGEDVQGRDRCSRPNVHRPEMILQVMTIQNLARLVSNRALWPQSMVLVGGYWVLEF